MRFCHNKRESDLALMQRRSQVVLCHKLLLHMNSSESDQCNVWICVFTHSQQMWGDCLCGTCSYKLEKLLIMMVSNEGYTFLPTTGVIVCPRCAWTNYNIKVAKGVSSKAEWLDKYILFFTFYLSPTYFISCCICTLTLS